MKRKTAVKFLMSLGFDRNYANLYLDELHAFGLTNYKCVLNAVNEIMTGIYNTIHVTPY